MPQAKSVKSKPTKKEAKAKTPPAPRKLVDMVDEILDEIDAVLEESCVARVYIQKGGE